MEKGGGEKWEVGSGKWRRVEVGLWGEGFVRGREADAF